MSPTPSCRRLVAAAAGLVADEMLGEPPLQPHPVAGFGKSMRVVERLVYRDRRAAGSVHVAVGLILGTASGAFVGSDAVSTYLAVAGRALRDAASDVEEALRTGDLELARTLIPTLVGRDPHDLDAKEMARAVVESVAENTVDAVVAPTMWSAVAGGAGALGYRAVNTMDAMVGHRSPRYENYGWAAARVDDLANLVPARLTAVLVAAVRPRRARAVLHVVRHQAPAHPSPNSGVAEAAFAAALDLRLGGTNRYGGRTEVRPNLGDGRPPDPDDIAAACRLSIDVGRALAALLLGSAFARGVLR